MGGAGGGERPVVGAEEDVAGLAAQAEGGFAAHAQEGQRVAGEDDGLVFQPSVAPREVAEGVDAGELAPLFLAVARREVVAADELLVGVFGKELVDAAVAPEGVVLPAEADEVGVGAAGGEGGAEEFALVLYLFPSAPAHAVAAHEMHFSGQVAAERRIVHVCVDVYEEVRLIIQCGDEAGEVGGVAVGGDEES